MSYPAKGKHLHRKIFTCSLNRFKGQKAECNLQRPPNHFGRGGGGGGGREEVIRFFKVIFLGMDGGKWGKLEVS